MKVLPSQSIDDGESSTTIQVNGEKHRLLYQNTTNSIYSYMFEDTKQASDTKKLHTEAKLVPWNVILKNHFTM